MGIVYRPAEKPEPSGHKCPVPAGENGLWTEEPEGTIHACDECGRLWLAVRNLLLVSWTPLRWYHFIARRHLRRMSA